MEKFETNNDLTLKIFSKENEELVSEQACTVLTISLNNDGEIFTTFLGAYNKDILKLLKNTQKTYYKNLAKKLKKGDIPTMTPEEAKLANSTEQSPVKAKKKKDPATKKEKTKQTESIKTKNKKEPK